MADLIGGLTDLDSLTGEIRAAGGVKDRMRAKGLRVGKCACPRCGVAAACVASLNGSRDHLHMTCTKCDFRMME